MMRVVMDVTPLAQHRGMGRYVRELLREFLKMGVPVRGSLRMGRPLRGDMIRHWKTARRYGVPVIPGFGLGLPGADRVGDVFHALEPSSWRKTRLPGVVTFHDFAQFRWESPRFSRIRRLLETHPPVRAVAVSHFTAREVRTWFPHLGDRIRVVYHGVRLEVYHPRTPEEVEPLLQRWGLSWRGYFLFVGEADRRKNLGVLRAVAEDPSLMPLVVVGTRPERVASFLDPGAPNLLILSPQPEDVLARLYAGALALLFPSREEGFGFPVLEAMACGTLVVTTPCTALPEVGGEVALYLSPEDPEAWRAMAHELAKDKGESHAERIQKGLERVKEFTWEKTARATLEVYREALEAGR